MRHNHIDIITKLNIHSEILSKSRQRPERMWTDYVLYKPVEFLMNIKRNKRIIIEISISIAIRTYTQKEGDTKLQCFILYCVHII